MRAWLLIVLVLVGCEDTRRSRVRHDRDEALPRAEAARAVPVPASCRGTDRCLPDFDLVDTEGIAHRTDDLDGKVVILSFWASWSSASAAEITMLSRIADRFAGRVLVFGLAIDANAQNYELEDQRQRLGMVYPAVSMLGLTSWITTPDVIPSTWVFDRHGLRIEQHVGPYDEDDLVEAIVGAL